jgi:hypothetical protein
MSVGSKAVVSLIRDRYLSADFRIRHVSGAENTGIQADEVRVRIIVTKYVKIDKNDIDSIVGPITLVSMQRIR